MAITNFIKHFFSLTRRAETITHRSWEGGWSLHRYIDDKGHFDYEKYRTSQISANKRKLGRVWAQRDNIVFVSEYLQRHLSHIEFGLCHGTRRGLEQKWFKELLCCEVIGTEISETAHLFPDTVQWDFHDVKDEWISSADFIYSNSLDHSYNPEACLAAWTSCLKQDGILILEHSTDDVQSRESDPFGAQLCILPYLILLWSKGHYSVRELIQAPKRVQSGGRFHSTFFLMIKRN